MADYQYVNSTGVIVPDTSTIQVGVQGEYTEAFATDMSVDPETPEGVLITAETVTRSEVVRNNAALANQINPNVAGGMFLKAICALTGLDPPAATFSTIANVAVTGATTFFLPIGSQAKTPAGDIFQTTAGVTFDADGNAVVNFQAVVAGPTPAVAHSLSVAVAVLGWENVDNANAAVLGQTEPSDDALRILRNNTLALQGSSLAEAIKSAVSVVPGFHSMQFRENKTGTDATIDGIFLLKNSVWACVQGGLDTDVATALLDSKSGGCNWNGAVTVNVTDPSSGQVYAVTFDRPTDVPVLVKATVRAPTAAIDPTNAVKQAVLDYANGLIPDQVGFVVGSSVSPFEISGAIMSEIPGVYVRKLEVALAPSGAYQTTEIALDLNEPATIAITDITVVVVS